MNDCIHELDAFDNETCILCGLCNLGGGKSVAIVSSYNMCLPRTCIDTKSRKLHNFINVMNLKSGKQPLYLKDKDKKMISAVISFLYGIDYNERKIRDVIKKLRLYKHVNNSYLIFCILKDIPCLRFDVYEPYFEYVYIKMYERYIILYPFKYFISSAFILNQLLNEVGIVSKYYFKDINTYEHHSNIYKTLRKIINITYTEFVYSKNAM